MIRILLIAILSLFIVDAFGQSMTKMNWKQKRNYADELFAKGDYSRAGQYFRSAYKSKPALEELTYKAGQCYMLSRNYKLAVNAYEPLKDNDKEFKDAGLLYAIALKHAGEYEKAIIELNEQSSRLGDEPNYLKYEIEDEIKGCELALQLEDAIDSSIKISHLGKNINTGSPQFSPRFISDEELIYSSININGFAKIYTSQKNNEDWTKGEIFPIQDIALPHYGNGTFSNDKKTFYFTQCELNSLQVPVCGIYVSELRSDIYSQPIKLSEKINEFEANTTHPYLYSDGNIDILLFSSNRSNGKGGQDLWFTMKKTGDSFTEFEAPVNLGSVINTSEDEITPFYDKGSGTLYFSSNGLVNVGGFDIYKSEGFRTKWSSPNNLGMPFNSNADDMFYSQSEGGGKLFVSNRKVTPYKLTTSDDDIFLVENPKTVKIIVAGQVIDRGTEEGLDDATVKLYRLNKQGDIALIKSKDCEKGKFSFELTPDKEYRIEATQMGYKSAFFDMATYKIKASVKIDQDVPLEFDSTVVVMTEPKMTETEASAILPDNTKTDKPSTEISIEEPTIASVETPSIEIETNDPIEGSTPKISLPDPVLETPSNEREEVEIPTVEVETPSVEAPTVETPAVKVETPTVETPSIETPTVSTPSVEAPTVETPSVKVETPTVETPSVETPTVSTPSVEAPTVETPSVKVETPAVETPSVETPTVETPSVKVETPTVSTPSIEIETPTVSTPTPPVTMVETGEPGVFTPSVSSPSSTIVTPTTTSPTYSSGTTTTTTSPTYSSGTITSSTYTSSPTYYSGTSSSVVTSASSEPNMNQYFSGPIDSGIYDYPGNQRASFSSSSIVSSNTYVTDSDVLNLIGTSRQPNDQFSSASSTTSPYPYTSPTYTYDSGSASTTVISSEPVISSSSTPVETVISSSPVIETIVEPVYESSTVLPREYKIQLAAIPNYTPSRYSKVEDLGYPIVLEGITTKNGDLQRVLVSGYTDPSDAFRVLKEIQGAGFPRAFMIRYDSGQRVPHTMRR